MSDLVTWRPGHPGKGWIWPDGTVVAWTVNARDEPNHADRVPEAERDGASRFKVLPTGELDSHTLSPRQQERVVSALMTRVRQLEEV